MFLRLALLGGTFLSIAIAQSWSFGIAGGGSLTDGVYNIVTPGPVPERSFSSSKDYLAGLTVEHPLPAGLSAEADVLYRELHQTTEGLEASGPNSVSPSPVVTWEFPVLAKYRFRASKLDPFIEAGPTFRTTGNFNGVFPSHYGVTAGVGIATHWGAFDFAPVIRYTRWEPDVMQSGAQSKQDQVELLLGISRRTRWGSSASGSRFSMGLAVGTNLVSDYPMMSGPTTINQIIPNPGGQGFTIQPVPATGNQSGSNSAIAGLAAEFGLPWMLYGEIDGLHHPLCRTDHTVSSTGFVYNSSGCGTSWEIPFLAKYKFGSGRMKLLLEAGPSVRTPSEIGVYGITAGAGLEIRTGVLKIAPCVRFTRWAPVNAGVSPVTRNAVELVTEFLL
jgi:hypothetical protein